MQKALQTRDSIGKQYVSKEEIGRGFATIEDGVNSPIRQLEDYIKKAKKV